MMRAGSLDAKLCSKLSGRHGAQRVWGENMTDETSPLVLACDHVIASDRPIRLIVHHSDGMWQLTCGEYDHSPEGATMRPVHIHHIVDDQSDLGEAMLKTPRSHLSELTQEGWLVQAHDD
jgi:hypothetical protein